MFDMYNIVLIFDRRYWSYSKIIRFIDGVYGLHWNDIQLYDKKKFINVYIRTKNKTVYKILRF